MKLVKKKKGFNFDCLPWETLGTIIAILYSKSLTLLSLSVGDTQKLTKFYFL